MRVKELVLFLLICSMLLSIPQPGVVSAEEVGYYSYDPRTSAWVWVTRPWKPTARTALITISIKGLPQEYSTLITVDGKPVGYIQGGGSRRFEVDKKSSHIFQVDEKVDGASFTYEGVTVGTRYKCPGNSWTLELVERTVTELVPVYTWVRVCNCLCHWELVVTYQYVTRSVSELAEQGHVFEYYTEHELYVMDPHGTQTREWLKEGTDVALSVKEEIVSITKDERDVFQHWIVNGVPVKNKAISEKMDRPLAAVAIYKRQYKLQVNSEFGDPSGSGWYDANSVAEISVQKSVPMGGLLGFLGGTYDFAGWIGADTNSPTSTVTMDGPKIVTAKWNPNPLAPIAILVIIIIAIFLAYRRGLLKPLLRAPAKSPPQPEKLDEILEYLKKNDERIRTLEDRVSKLEKSK